MGNNHHHDHDHEHYYDDSYLHDNQFVFLNHYIHMLEMCKSGLKHIIDHDHTEFGKEKLNDCLLALKAMDNANFLAGNLMRKIDRETYEKIQQFESLDTYINQLSGEIENDSNKINVKLLEQLYNEYKKWSEQVVIGLKKHLPRDSM